MPVIRKKLFAGEVYPTNIRYNPGTDTVQSEINDEWVDNPAADPRTQTTYPPRLTADPACDAAKSVVVALKNQIDQTITAVGDAQTAATIAGLILGLFSFGVFAIFISIALFIADTMLSAGTAALEAALTPGVYETLKCILNCHMTAQGRVKPGELPAIEGEVTDQIGGLAATILNAMLSLAGEGGINNLASLGTSTGDCSECGCNCGFTTDASHGYNFKRWILLDHNLDPSSFTEGIDLHFAPTDEIPPPDATTVMYSPGFYGSSLGAMTEFDEPCFIDTVAVHTTGYETFIARMCFGYRIGTTWTLVDNVVRDPWGNGETFTIGMEVDAVGFQYVNGGKTVDSVIIN